MSVLISLLAAGLQSQAAPSVAIKDFAGEIRVEQGDALAVRIDRSGGFAPVISQEDGRIAVDGRLYVREWRCYQRRGVDRVGTALRHSRTFDQLPVLVITTPEPPSLDIRRSIVRADTGDLAALSLSASRCGAVVAGDVDGAAEVTVRGPMQVSLGSAGVLLASVSGSGAVSVRADAPGGDGPDRTGGGVDGRPAP